MNKLYYGDCFRIMQDYVRDASVDLIYLDPPFNSNRQYSAIYQDETGRPLPDQVEAFCDMWELDAKREEEIRRMPVLMRESGVPDEGVQLWRLWMHSLRNTRPRLLAYLSYMTQRLLVMHRKLKRTGSFYLHCDPTASHYIKALLDAIMGHQNFRNEIVWKRTTSHNDAGTLGSVHDVLLHYSRSEHFTWNHQFAPYSADYIAERYRRKDPDGRRWMDGDLSAKGLSGGGYEYEYRGAASNWRVPLATMHRLDSEGQLHFTSRGGIRIKRYLDEMPGVPLNDVWTDIPPINSQANERMGYATQKPVALMARIIKASSNPGDVVLDPFCGCATTLEAAHALGRRWIGIDIAIHAIKRVARIRLNGRLGLVEGRDYEVEGVPRNLEGAQDLWRRDKYHFQTWAVEQIDGFVTSKRTVDGGVDGRVYFATAYDEPLQSMIVEVKGGTHVSIADLRALKGVLETDDALMAGLIVMSPRSQRQQRNFDQFMASAGTLSVLGRDYPRMQMLTVREIVDGKRFGTPTVFGRAHPEPQFPGLPAPVR